MNIKKICIALSAVLLLGCSFTACGDSKPALQINNTEMYSQELRDYLLAGDEYEQIMALQYADIYDAQITNVTWSAQKNADEYGVVLSRSQDMREAIEYIVDGSVTKYTFNTLIPATKYYVKLRAYDDGKQVFESKAQSFQTQGDSCARFVNVDGVSNVRDIGGYKAQDGSKVKYGLIYRGARLNGITDDGIATFTQELNIKTELDVRYGTDGGKVLAMDGVTYKQLGMWAYTSILPDTCQPKPQTSGLFDQRTIEGIKGTFETIANPDNLPVYIHCTAGADRTGTICYLINGVLGVDYEDLAQDFELTSFSEQGRRWRSSVDDWAFDETGIMQNDEKNYVAFGLMHSLMMQWYAPSGGTLQQAIENYLINECGISMETINAVRDNLLA